MNESPREGLLRLIADFRAGTLTTEAFCSRFESIYNLELDRQTLTLTEAEAFTALFDQVVWYSPFPDERAQIPNYRSEEEIANAVEDAFRQLDYGDAYVSDRHKV